MANPEHLKILKQGVKAWNAWRKKRKTERIDLIGADLGNVDVSNADLNSADLRGANFIGANLSGANLGSADLRSANFGNADLRSANLGGANFSGANLHRTNLFRANIHGADLDGANLSFADLCRADLSSANLRGADLSSASFIRTTLTKSNLSKAEIGLTTFGSVDLREVIGLDAVIHLAPSTVGINTLYKSHGEIPDKFLRDAGVPEEIITHIVPSIRNGPAIQWHSCFISYSTKDEEFARRLHSRMREANMRVWFAPEDLKGGKKLHEQLFEAIQIHDRLLIVLSEHSIQSEWVKNELRKAFEVERKEKSRKLFPIRLTDFETLNNWTFIDTKTGVDLAKEVRGYAMPNDFSNWKNHDAFESAFARLKKNLEAENSKTR